MTCGRFLMMTAEQSEQVASVLRKGHATRIFDLWNKHLSTHFSDGERGWELYVACSKLVIENAPSEHEEFKRRFGHLPNDEAMMKGKGIGLKALLRSPKPYSE
jgi:hypothetical protein